jgi:hypothetical protein
MKTTNNDTGSLKVGTSAGDHVWEVGQKVKIGERTVTITYIMGRGEKTHICFGKQGFRCPEGEVEYSVV